MSPPASGTSTHEQKLSLPDKAVSIFYIFNAVIYTVQLKNEHGISDAGLLVTVPCKLWVFGDRYMIPALQDAGLDVITKKLQKLQGCLGDIMVGLYEQTTENSPFRKFLIDWQAHRRATNIHSLQEWPKEALVDLDVASARTKSEHRGKDSLPDDLGKCHYHIPVQGEHC